MARRQLHGRVFFGAVINGVEGRHSPTFELTCTDFDDRYRRDHLLGRQGISGDLATPISIMVGVGRGARGGVLIKDAEGLELMQKVE